MVLYKKDPIVEAIMRKAVLFKKTLDDKTLDELNRILSDFNEAKEKVDVLALLLFMEEKFQDNSRVKIETLDCLITLGFYFDAEKRAERYCSQTINHVLILERLITLKIFKREYTDVYQLCVMNHDKLITHKRLYSIFLDILKTTENFGLYNHFVSKFNEVFSEHRPLVVVNNAPCTLNDLYLLFLNQDTKAHDATWQLYHSGERSLAFFKLATQRFMHESDASLRLSFFRNEAIKYFPEDLEFFYLVISHKIFLKFYEEAYYLFYRKDIKKILLDISIDEEIRKKIYHLHLKFSILVEHKKDTLLDHNDAKSCNLLQPYILDLRRLISCSIINNDAEILKQSELIAGHLGLNVQNDFQAISDVITKNIHQYNKSCVSTQMVVSGQFRGGEVSEKFLNSFSDQIGVKNIRIYTWDTQPSTPNRFNALGRLFDNECVQLIPLQYRNTEFFIKNFPSFFNAIYSVKNLKIDRNSFSFDKETDINIYNEKDFESLYGNNPRMFSIRRLNQAKMFFMNSECSKYQYGSMSIIRMRPDLNVQFNFKLQDYIKTTQIVNQHVLYVHYFSGLGFIGDQFSLSDLLSFTNLNALYDLSIQEQSLVYASYFEKDAQLGGETLLTNHAIAMGLNVRYIHPIKNLFNNIDHFSVIDYEDALKSDYGNLPISLQKELAGWYNYLKNYKNN